MGAAWINKGVVIKTKEDSSMSEVSKIQSNEVHSVQEHGGNSQIITERSNEQLPHHKISSIGNTYNTNQASGIEEFDVNEGLK